MPDHVHVIGSPQILLDKLLKGIKGASARTINRALKREGSVWQQESFDHELRRDESLIEKAEYVAMNPVRKGLVERPEDYPWLWIPEQNVGRVLNPPVRGAG
jgi:REP element-mobilizing transposase RayT